MRIAAPVFTWSPLIEPTGETKFSTRAAQFGDGYSQVVANGINNKADTWPLSFAGNSTYLAPIKAFLDGLFGVRSFLWTPPLRTQGLFRAGSYTVSPKGGDVYQLDVTFTEVFSA
ncbi:phage tail protein [Ralstonia solanacearum]|nr:phage tail protein [Ralstonia solanacearum]QKL77338.1 phage tail protein [Ralstonia solanacearum]QKL82544.1 phage tail protein [Ralstonia solanacearum]QKL87754.1 phage tail protein [Ralstonia solanacearum]QKM03121.1 phage tail protein [Ralstonia solanacearum]